MGRTQLSRLAGLVTVVAIAFAAPPAAALPAALPEWRGPFPKAFTATSEGSLFEQLRRAQVTCKADTVSGEVTAPSGGPARITFTGCEGFRPLPCQNIGAERGKVVTEPLTTQLGYVNAEHKVVGLELAPRKGDIFAEFECETPEGPVKVKLDGSVIGTLTPVNKRVMPPARFVLKFAQRRSKQKPDKFEGGPETQLREVGFAGVEKLRFGEATEIRA